MPSPGPRHDRPDQTRQKPSDGPRLTKTRTRVAVLIRSRPRYVPGCGPPLQPPRLLPPQDSTAYIVDRILLPSPGPAANGRPLPKRMSYIIGWHDLPAARLLVPAMRILDYVSPGVLEDWEWKLELELDEERARLKHDGHVHGLAKRAPPAIGQKLKKKKKRGRPPAHTQIEAAAVVNSETEAQAAAPPAKGVMNLSKLKKSPIKDFKSLSEDELSPSRQVEEELLASQTRPSAQPATLVAKGTTGSMSRSLNSLLVQATPVKIATSIEPSDFTHPAQKQTPLPPLRPAPPPRPYDYNFSFTPISASLQNRFSSDNRSDGLGYTSDNIPSATASNPHSPFGSTQQDNFTPHKQYRNFNDYPDDTPVSKPKKRQKKEDPQTPTIKHGEPVWEVQRLEDMQWYDVEGRGLVRYFKVRWEGDWPPDQNPSWEPEENIPASMVRNYLKNPRRGSRAAKAGVKRRPAPPATCAPVRKYSSVSEAFSAEVEDDTMDLVPAEDPREELPDPLGHDEPELFVVEEDADSGRGRTMHNGGHALGRTKLDFSRGLKSAWGRDATARENTLGWS